MMEQPTMEALLGAMRMAEHAGAKAFAINFAALGPDGWSREAMRRIFSFTPRPCMPYTYRGHHLSGAPDEKRAELQLQAAEEGAAGSDLMGDLFDPSPRELTLKPEAIRLKVPFVQLCNGRFARLQRYVGPVLGSMLTFTVPVYDENHLGNQPLTEAASRTLHELLWHRG